MDKDTMKAQGENEEQKQQGQGKEQGSVSDQGQSPDLAKGAMNFNKIASIGFFGGIFWSTVSFVLSFFDFTQIGPTFVLEKIPLGKWANFYIEVLLSIFCIGIISIVIAFIYFFIGKKFTGVLPGVFYGLLWWVIIFLVLGRIAFDLKPIKDYSSDTMVTSICLFILYGTFISYSVSFASQEEEPYLRGYSK